MEEETRNGDHPPAYCSLYRPVNSSDTVNNSDVIVSDLDEESLVALSFEDKSTRIVFIQKVLAIRCLQAAAASGIIAVVYRSFDLDYWLHSYTYNYFLLTFSLVHAATIIPLRYWKDVEKTPYNYLFLVANTISTALILTVINTGSFKIEKEFYVAWMLYALMTLALFLYAVLILGTSLEFRARDASLLAGGLSILLNTIAITALIQDHGPYDIFPIIYLAVPFFLVCAHAVYRLQLITSGEYHRALTPTDFVSAALFSPIDLVRDFVYLPVYLLKSISDME